MSRVDAELVANADQNGQQAVEVGVGIEQQSQRHAQDADDDGQETAQRCRDEACHDDCHLLHDAALAQDTEEDTGTQDGGSHAQASGSVALDDGVVQLLAAVVDQNAQSAADHEDVVRGEDVQNQHDDDGQSQDDVEDEVLGTSQSLILLAVVGVVVLAGVLSSDGIAELCDALLLLQAPEDGGADSTRPTICMGMSWNHRSLGSISMTLAARMVGPPQGIRFMTPIAVTQMSSRVSRRMCRRL